MDFRVIIPARHNAKRLPGKVLLEVAGKTILQHVYEKAVDSGADTVVIATDDQRIADVAEGFEAQVCMTSSEHRSGTDRVAEAVVALGYDDDEVVVQLHADRPLTPVKVIRQVARNIHEFQTIRVATVCEILNNTDELFNPRYIKVVFNRRQFALYFSRAPIPWVKGKFPPKENQPLENEEHYRHIGIYAYRAGFLQEFMEWGHSPLEEMEGLEQLRVLWQGGRVHVAIAEEKSPTDVNTKEDFEIVKKILEKSR